MKFVASVKVFAGRPPFDSDEISRRYISALIFIQNAAARRGIATSEVELNYSTGFADRIGYYTTINAYSEE